jgi:hypothetical protein
MKMPAMLATVTAISIVSLQYCSALRIYHSHSNTITGFRVAEQIQAFALWNAPTNAFTQTLRCVHDSTTYMAVGSFETAHRIPHQSLISRLKSRVVFLAKPKSNQPLLHSFFDLQGIKTRKSAARLAVATLALFIFFLCFAPKPACAANVLVSSYQQLLAGVSGPMRYFSNILPAG